MLAAHHAPSIQALYDLASRLAGLPRQTESVASLAPFFRVTDARVVHALDALIQVMDLRPEHEQWGPIRFSELLAECTAAGVTRPESKALGAALDVLGYRPKLRYTGLRRSTVWLRPWHGTPSPSPDAERANQPVKGPTYKPRPWHPLDGQPAP